MKFVGVHWSTIQVKSSYPRVSKKKIHNRFMHGGHYNCQVPHIESHIISSVYIAMDSSPDKEVMELLNHNFPSKE